MAVFSGMGTLTDPSGNKLTYSLDVNVPDIVTPPPPSVFVLGQRPFKATSSWNTTVSTNAIYSSVAWPASTGYNYSVNWDSYSPAVYVSSTSDPLVQVTIPAAWGYPAGNIAVHLKAGVSGAAGTDGEILVIDETTIHNFWQFKRTGTNTATANAYGRTDVLTGSGWGSKSPFLSAGTLAVGASQFAGLLVQTETDAGQIPHALQLVTDSALTQPGFTGEAIAGDGGAANGIVQEGQRLAIPRTTPIPSGLSALGQKVFLALQNYGCFCTDIAGGVTVLRAQANAYDSATMTALWHDMTKVIPLLKRI